MPLMTAVRNVVPVPCLSYKIGNHSSLCFGLLVCFGGILSCAAITCLYSAAPCTLHSARSLTDSEPVQALLRGTAPVSNWGD